MSSTGGPEAAPSDYLSQRYGNDRRARTGGARASAIGSAIVAVLVTLVVAWIAVTDARDTISATTFGYEVQSPSSVSVTWELYRADPAAEVVCAVEALDATRGQVGVELVTIPPGTSERVMVTTVVTTLAPPVQAGAQGGGCLATGIFGG